MYRWLNNLSQQFLDKGYLVNGQSVDERVTEICDYAERLLDKPGFSKQFKANFEKGWYSFSTPIWANFGNNRALPISCFNTFIDDNMESILAGHSEIGMMTKLGGGTSAYFGELRARGVPIRNNGESNGPIHFMQMFDTLISVISQGSTRRGVMAAYLPIEHPDADDFLSIRSEGHYIQDLSTGITITDKWMQEMIDGDEKKRILWAKVLQSRINTGYPYIMFVDNANNNTSDVYKDKGMKIHSSNVCSEIMLPSSSDESFVCDLSSMNILYYDEWKDTNAVELLVYFLDAVMTDFINRAKDIPYMQRAVRFAQRHRALGIGWLGWHSYLQSKMIAFESMTAKLLNVQIAKNIVSSAYSASMKLAEEYGEPELLKGYYRRNTTLIAIAPTKSSAFILGQVSEGIEPNRSNYYIKDLAKGKFTVKNPYLVETLEKIGYNNDKVWDSILKNNGSVQHLDVLSEQEKAVFKTFQEISPMEVVIQAAQRQKYIDQGQSLNLMIHPNVPIKEINTLMIEAWKLGIKSLYYQYSVNSAHEFSRSILSCSSCEG